MSETTIAHGKKTVAKLIIKKINVDPNGNDRVSIITSAHEINESGVYQLSENWLERIAKDNACTDATMLRNAHADSFDNNFLVVDAMYVHAGEPVLDEKTGEQLEDAVDGPMTYKVNHWKIMNYELELGEDATDYISGINKQIDMQMALEARKSRSKRNRRKAAPKQETVATTETPAEEDL